jgi:hypothetical protein
MATFDSTREGIFLELLLPGFEPVSELWEGSTPVFPSENSARWLLKQQRQALLDAEALALHRGRLFVHRERLLQVARQHAMAACRQQYAAGVR